MWTTWIPWTIWREVRGSILSSHMKKASFGEKEALARNGVPISHGAISGCRLRSDGAANEGTPPLERLSLLRNQISRSISGVSGEAETRVLVPEDGFADLTGDSKSGGLTLYRALARPSCMRAERRAEIVKSPMRDPRLISDPHKGIGGEIPNVRLARA